MTIFKIDPDDDEMAGIDPDDTSLDDDSDGFDGVTEDYAIPDDDDFIDFPEDYDSGD